MIHAYLHLLARYWIVWVAALVTGALAGRDVAMRVTPEYDAQVVFDVVPLWNGDTRVPDAIRLLGDPATARLVAAEPSPRAASVDADALARVRLVIAASSSRRAVVNVRASSRAAAAAVADAYAATAPRAIDAPMIAAVGPVIRRLREEISRTRSDALVAERAIEDLVGTVTVVSRADRQSISLALRGKRHPALAVATALISLERSGDSERVRRAAAAGVTETFRALALTRNAALMRWRLAIEHLLVQQGRLSRPQIAVAAQRDPGADPLVPLVAVSAMAGAVVAFFIALTIVAALDCMSPLRAMPTRVVVER